MQALLSLNSILALLTDVATCPAICELLVSEATLLLDKFFKDAPDHDTWYCPGERHGRLDERQQAWNARCGLVLN